MAVAASHQNHLQKFPTQYSRLSERALAWKPGQSLGQGHQHDLISHFRIEYRPKQII